MKLWEQALQSGGKSMNKSCRFLTRVSTDLSPTCSCHRVPLRCPFYSLPGKDRLPSKSIIQQRVKRTYESAAAFFLTAVPRALSFSPQRFGKSRTLFTWYFTCKGRSLNLRAGVALWVILTALFSHSRTLLLMIKGAIVSVVKSVLVCLSVLHKAERKQWSLVSRLARPRSLLFTLSWRFRPSLGSRIVPKPFCKQENV